MHVEDRLELRHAAGEVFTQLFALRDIAAGEQHAAPAARVGERHERRLDQPAPAAVLERHAHRHDGHAAGRDVHLLGQVGERVGKCVVDRAPRRLRESSPVRSR